MIIVENSLKLIPGLMEIVIEDDSFKLLNLQSYDSMSPDRRNTKVRFPDKKLSTPKMKDFKKVLGAIEFQF